MTKYLAFLLFCSPAFAQTQADAAQAAALDSAGEAFSDMIAATVRLRADADKQAAIGLRWRQAIAGGFVPAQGQDITQMQRLHQMAEQGLQGSQATLVAAMSAYTGGQDCYDRQDWAGAVSGAQAANIKYLQSVLQTVNATNVLSMSETSAQFYDVLLATKGY